MDSAPFFEDVADGPDGGAAYWLSTSDNVRIRLAVWPAQNDLRSKGTVLIFPGRTEYAEKYGPTAAFFAQQGYASIAVDWRGQGIADRLLPDRSIGHVGQFSDYQRDVQAVLTALRQLELPKPWFLVGHSMGGCIGLRALMEGLPVARAAFSAPMWGIEMGALAFVGWSVATIFPKIGLGHMRMPTTPVETYVLSSEFADNTLTTDPEMWEFMRRQVQSYPELALGGPSTLWTREALHEMAALAKRPSPNVSCLTIMGTNERIVAPDQVVNRMERWPNGRLEIVEGAEHELIMEAPTMRNFTLDQLLRHFEAA